MQRGWRGEGRFSFSEHVGIGGLDYTVLVPHLDKEREEENNSLGINTNATVTSKGTQCSRRGREGLLEA